MAYCLDTNILLRWIESGTPMCEQDDTRIAAAMPTHGVTHLLTVNVRDFKRFWISVDF